MIVVDASVVVDALLGGGAARALLAEESLFAPHLVDTEVLSALRRRVAARAISADDASVALAVLRRLGITRYPTYGLTERVWELRDTLTAYDATYVAVAEALECALVTLDRGIAGAPGPRCAVTLLGGT